MTWYREIDVLGEPSDVLGLDDQERARYSFNIRAIKTASDTFAEEVVALLQTAGVGTFGTDIFIGRKADIPTGDGPYLSVLETGGTSPERIQNQVSPPAYPRPSALLVARATNPVAAKAMARAAYNALAGVRNRVVTA